MTVGSMMVDEEIEEAIRNGDIIVHSEDMSSLNIQPCSLELRLGPKIKYPRPHAFATKTFVEHARRTLPSLGFALASTMETLTLGPSIVGEVMGKSSIAREGLAVHITAGLIDPGFSGQITLELFNASPWDFELKEGMSICQVVFFRTSRPARRPYGSPGLGSHYQGQSGPTESRRDR